MDFASGFLPVGFEANVLYVIFDSYSHLIHPFPISVFPIFFDFMMMMMMMMMTMTMMMMMVMMIMMMMMMMIIIIIIIIIYQ